MHRARDRSRSGGGALVSQAAIVAAIVLAANGALYDPSDLTSLYQGRTGGSTGATGQPVGIMLDKSYMGGQTAAAFIAGQAEVSKGAWTQVTATATISGEDVSLSGGAGFAAVGRQVTVTTGRWCVATVNVSAVTGTCSFEHRNSNTPGGGSRLVAQPFTTTGVKTLLFIGNASGNNIEVRGDGVGATISFTSLSVKEIPGFHALAPSDAARPVLTVAGSLAYLAPDGVDDWMNVGPVLDLSSAWWSVGGWLSSATGDAPFATTNQEQSALSASGKWTWYNTLATQVDLVVGTITAAHVLTIEQASASSMSARFNAIDGLTIDPYDGILPTNGLALFSRENDVFAVGLAGRFYGGSFCPGALTSGNRAIVEAYVAALTGVTL